MTEEIKEEDLQKRDPIVRVETRFGDLLLYDLFEGDDRTDEHWSRLYLVLSTIVKKDEDTTVKEIQPYYIEIPVPPYCKDRKKWGEEVLLANKGKFLTLFFFAYVRCPNCKDPLPVMRDPLSELFYCPTCGIELK